MIKNTFQPKKMLRNCQPFDLKVPCKVRNGRLVCRVGTLRTLVMEWAIVYSEKHENRELERHFGSPPTQKVICDWEPDREELENTRGNIPEIIK